MKYSKVYVESLQAEVERLRGEIKTLRDCEREYWYTKAYNCGKATFEKLQDVMIEIDRQDKLLKGGSE
jgi:hypothetical protein